MKPWLNDALAANGRTVAENFANWFDGSCLVEEDGTPTLFFHGTPHSFDHFLPNKDGLIFFAQDPEHAVDLGSRFDKVVQVMPVFVRCDRPFEPADRDHLQQLEDKIELEVLVRELEEFSQSEWTEKGVLSWLREGRWQVFEQPSVLDAIRAQGFDGLFVEELGQIGLAVFDPCQVKSAIGNSGLFIKGCPSLTDHQSALDLELAKAARSSINASEQRCRP